MLHESGVKYLITILQENKIVLNHVKIKNNLSAPKSDYSKKELQELDRIHKNEKKNSLLRFKSIEAIDNLLK